MPTKEKSSVPARKTPDKPSTLPDDFPTELRGEFEQLPEQLTKNLGTIAGYAIADGGYFGISVTDDRDSCKLAVRCKSVTFEKRVGSITQLETLLAYCLRKLTDK